jgi:hypothetical protein
VYLPCLEVVRLEWSSICLSAELKMVRKCFDPAEQPVFKRLPMLLKPVLAEIALGKVT